MEGVTVYKGAHNKSYFVSEDKELSKKAIKKAIHQTEANIIVSGCYVLGDDLYLDVPDEDGWKAMYVAYSR